MADDKAVGEGDNNDAAAAAAAAASGAPEVVAKKKRKNILSRMLGSLFRHGDDFEKRLQYLSKEEMSVVNRIKRRSVTRRSFTRNLIVFSVVFEVIAIGYAIATTRTIDLDWRVRAFRILPMFLLPALSTLSYTGFVNFTRMRDRKDNKTLEKLRAEKQAKINELKEKTNYYSTQQLIQKYDPDPAAKAAAATVLASKLGLDSGLRFHVGDESNANTPTGRSNDAQFAHSGELRNRKQIHTRSSSMGSAQTNYTEEDTPRSAGSEGSQTPSQLVVAHQNPQAYATQDGGWIARIAALLVGEDPTQSYALICGNCHMHNGLAKKEDFAFITYYCPHCHALNRPKHLEGAISGSGSPESGSLRAGVRSDAANQAIDSLNASVLTSTGSLVAVPEIEEVTESSVSGKVTERTVSGELPDRPVSDDTDMVNVEEKHE